MTPPHAQKHVDVAVTAGTPSTATDAEPGAHGPVGTGRQAAGVRTPSAAVVAAATAGLVGVTHMLNVEMFVVGTTSVTTAIGAPASAERGAPATRDEGATPMLHAIVVPVVTASIVRPPLVPGTSEPSGFPGVNETKAPCTSSADRHLGPTPRDAEGRTSPAIGEP